MTASPPSAPALLLLLLLASPAALAQEPEEPDTSTPDAETSLIPGLSVDPHAAPWKTRYGARLVAGAPEGLGVAALIQPRPWLRAHAGATRNTLGYGVRAGVDLLPLALTFSPVLALEYGHAFSADYGKLLDQLHGQSVTPATTIQRVAYDQLAASVGLEFSPWSHLTLFGGVGISYWFIGVSDANSFIREATDTPGLTSTPLLIGLSSPVAKLGVLLSFD